MKLSDTKKQEFTKKILLSRLRILNNFGFYGLLLMHMRFGLDESCKTAYTDGHKICFSPTFLEGLSNKETDFVMMHEILHVVLKHVYRGNGYDPIRHNIAADIVVNSNILYSNNMDLSSISISGLGPLMHTINNKEGYLFTFEEVYNMLGDLPKNKSKNSYGSSDVFDDHSHWCDIDEDNSGYYIDEWEQRLLQASEALQIKESSNKRGLVPLGALRIIKDLKDSTIDWRSLLIDFITYEVNDYSFTPPDRRFSDFDYFLPDFNEKEEALDINVLFEVDTSGSMSDDDIRDVYSEINGAIEQSNGKLKGWLGFYDANAYEPKPFDSFSDITEIKPRGGGGTSCSAVFENLNYIENIIGRTPDAIIFLTDGYDYFPKEEARRNIPVFWIITNDKVTPSWGVVARMKKSKK